MSSEQKLIRETLHLVNRILEILEFPLEIHPQSLDALHDDKIYFEIANVLFPYLQYNLLQISKKKLSSGEKIDMLIKVLENDILKKPLSNISGEAVADGNSKHVYDLVEVLYQLAKRHATSQERSDPGDEGSEHVHSVLGIQHEFEDEEEDNPQSHKDSPDQHQRNYEHLLEGQQIIDDRLHQLKRPILQPKKSDDSSGFGDVLERKHFDAISSPKPQVKSNKTLKQTIKKQIQSRLFSSNTNKKLTTNLRNAVSEKRLLSPKAREFAEVAYQHVANTRGNVASNEYELAPKRVDEAMERKNRQFRYVIKDHKEKQRLKGSRERQVTSLSSINNLKKIHYLKVTDGVKQVRHAQQRARVEEHERAVEMKLRDQKCRYLRKINGLVKKLEKDRNLDERRQFREKLLSENRATAQQLQALELYYMTQMNLLKEKEQAQRKDRKLVESAHRIVVNKLQKELRVQNEKRMAKLQQRYMEEYNKMAEFEQIEKDLIRLYKKY